MGVNLENIDAALDAATKEIDKETGESPTPEVITSLEAKTESDSKPKKSGANERIRELVTATKELKDVLTEKDSVIKERDAEISKLIELVQAKEQDSRIVAKVNELWETKSELKPLLEVLDKAVRGEDVTQDLSKFSKEIDKSDLSKEDKAIAKDNLLKTKELLEETKGDLETQITNQRHEIIIHKVELLTDKYLKELPKEYGDDDIRIVRESLADRVDWDKIDENPELLNAEFKRGFENTLKWYGTPKGTVKASGETKGNNEVTPEKIQTFIKQDWGRLKMVEDAKGNKKELPEVSDADFVAAMAESLRNVRRLQR